MINLSHWGPFLIRDVSWNEYPVHPWILNERIFLNQIIWGFNYRFYSWLLGCKDMIFHSSWIKLEKSKIENNRGVNSSEQRHREMTKWNFKMNCSLCSAWICWGESAKLRTTCDTEKTDLSQVNETQSAELIPKLRI